jgi:signal transduction histidine kinase
MPRRAPGRSVQELEALLAEREQERAVDRARIAHLERETAALRRERDDSVDQLTASGEVLHAISRSPTDLQRVLDTIAERAGRLCGGLTGTVWRVEGTVARLRARWIAPGGPDPVALLSALGETRPIDRRRLQGLAMLERRTVYVPDVRAIPEVEMPLPSARRDGFRTLAAAPLLRDAEPVGAIFVSAREPNALTERHLRLLETFADQAVIAIENARLFQELADKSAQLEQASQHKSEFLANMSHELRTPLNAIIGFTEVLLEKYFGEVNAKQEDYLKDVLTSGQHLLALINDILDLSKVEAGRMELELATFDLGPALEAGLVMVKERASRGGIALSLEVAEKVGRIEADERKVKQVLFNLLTNAVKFTPDGGKVTVSARRGDGRVEVAVADTGVGIAPEDLGRIFDEFGQARNQAGQGEGTGLGLALCKRFVELHGGTVAVTSEVGVGSTFTVALPARQPARPTDAPDGA